MTQSDSDEVLNTPDPTNPGGGSSSPSPSSSEAAATQADSKGEPKGSPSGEAPAKDGAKDGEEAAASEPTNDEKVARAQSDAQEWKDKYVRLHAEWDTYRRRTADQRAEEKATATEKLVEHLLPVIDDFERTIDYAESNGETGLLGGVKAVRAKLIDALTKEGVKVLDPKGEAFDPLECQAISTKDDKTVPDETVAEVFQKGYKMGRKVLRPAMVTVATGGPKRETPPDAENTPKK